MKFKLYLISFFILSLSFGCKQNYEDKANLTVVQKSAVQCTADSFLIKKQTEKLVENHSSRKEKILGYDRIWLKELEDFVIKCEMNDTVFQYLDKKYLPLIIRMPNIDAEKAQRIVALVLVKNHLYHIDNEGKPENYAYYHSQQSSSRAIMLSYFIRMTGMISYSDLSCFYYDWIISESSLSSDKLFIEGISQYKDVINKSKNCADNINLYFYK